MLYWMNYGSQKEVLERKLLFSVHRKAFEETIINSKEEIITRISRRIGSGSEVTYPTARYFHGLLKLLTKHSDLIESTEFRSHHEQLIETLGKKKSLPEYEERESKSRIFTSSQKTTTNIKDYLLMFNECGICRGRYFPGMFTQADHIEPRKKGGKTTTANARNTHPFCNNNREKIEKLLKGDLVLALPAFNDADTTTQLSFLDFFNEGLEDLNGGEDGDTEEPTEET